MLLLTESVVITGCYQCSDQQVLAVPVCNSAKFHLVDSGFHPGRKRDLHISKYGGKLAFKACAHCRRKSAVLCIESALLLMNCVSTDEDPRLRNSLKNENIPKRQSMPSQGALSVHTQ